MAIFEIEHAEGTRERHKAEMAVAKLTADLKKHAALTEVKNLQKAESDLRDATKALQALENSGSKSAARLQKAKTLVDEKQKHVAKVAESYEPKRADYQSKKDQLEKEKEIVKNFSETGVRWKFETPHDSALIVAGNTLIVGGKNEVIALEVESGKPVWQTKVDGEARGLAASGGHLAVSTSTGKIYTFADATHTGPPQVAAQKGAGLKPDPFPKGYQ